jgi:hypothetical protein
LRLRFASVPEVFDCLTKFLFKIRVESHGEGYPAAVTEISALLKREAVSLLIRCSASLK